MSSGPPQGSSTQEAFEDPLDVIPIVKEAKDIWKFRETRRAVLAGDPLYFCTESEIRDRGLMGPWAFNATQSIVASIPGMLMSACLWIFLPGTDKSLALGADPVQAQISTVLAPLRGPLTLLLIVYGIAFACIPSGYFSKENWRAAQRKYLYLDGAYGLWPQLVLATCIAMASVPRSAAIHHPIARTVLLVGVVGFWAALFWQGTLTHWKIKADLFEYDYLSNRPEMFVVLEQPTVKFYVLTAFTLPIVLVLLSSLFHSSAALLAHLVHLARS